MSGALLRGLLDAVVDGVAVGHGCARAAGEEVHGDVESVFVRHAAAARLVGGAGEGGALDFEIRVRILPIAGLRRVDDLVIAIRDARNPGRFLGRGPIGTAVDGVELGQSRGELIGIRIAMNLERIFAVVGVELSVERTAREHHGRRFDDGGVVDGAVGEAERIFGVVGFFRGVVTRGRAAIGGDAGEEGEGPRLDVRAAKQFQFGAHLRTVWAVTARREEPKRGLVELDDDAEDVRAVEAVRAGAFAHRIAAVDLDDLAEVEEPGVGAGRPRTL